MPADLAKYFDFQPGSDSTIGVIPDATMAVEIRSH
jgi:hypothetical protein